MWICFQIEKLHSGAIANRYVKVVVIVFGCLQLIPLR
jgi:hypothetical protein